jgi:predicted transcriptional regulator
MGGDSLNENEMEALRLLWAVTGGLKQSEIQAGFAWEIENATLRSVLVNLVNKGLAVRKQRGKAFYYAARVSKAALLQQALRSLARVFSGGSTRDLVVQLVETGDLGPEDMMLLRQVAEGERPPKPRKRSRS